MKARARLRGAWAFYCEHVTESRWWFAVFSVSITAYIVGAAYGLDGVFTAGTVGVVLAAVVLAPRLLTDLVRAARGEDRLLRAAATFSWVALYVGLLAIFGFDLSALATLALAMASAVVTHPLRVRVRRKIAAREAERLRESELAAPQPKRLVLLNPEPRAPDLPWARPVGAMNVLDSVMVAGPDHSRRLAQAKRYLERKMPDLAGVGGVAQAMASVEVLPSPHDPHDFALRFEAKGKLYVLPVTVA